MSLPELLPMLHALPRAEKLRLIQFMIADIASEEGMPPIEAAPSFPVWSPHHAFDAADVMLRVLAEEKSG